MHHAQGNGFCRVYHTASSHSQNTVHTLSAAQLNTLPYQAQARVRFYPTQLDKGDIGTLQSLHHSIIQAGALNTAATIMQQQFFVLPCNNVPTFLYSPCPNT